MLDLRQNLEIFTGRDEVHLHIYKTMMTHQVEIQVVQLKVPQTFQQSRSHVSWRMVSVPTLHRMSSSESRSESNKVKANKVKHENGAFCVSHLQDVKSLERWRHGKLKAEVLQDDMEISKTRPLPAHVPSLHILDSLSATSLEDMTRYNGENCYHRSSPTGRIFHEYKDLMSTHNTKACKTDTSVQIIDNCKLLSWRSK